MKVYENETFEKRIPESGELSGCSFIDCSFVDCVAIGLKITNCTFTDCRFERCRLTDVKPSNSRLRDVTFRGCALQGINFGMWTLKNEYAMPISMVQDCILLYCMFTGMQLRKFNFAGNRMTECTFADSNLSDADFRRCRLEKSEFMRCDLRNADFRDASGYRVDIGSNKLKNARFSFPEVINLLSGLEIKID